MCACPVCKCAYTFFWLDAYCCSLIECVIWDWLQSKQNLAFGALLPVFEIQAVFFTRQYLLVRECNIVVWRFNNQCYFVQLCKMYMLWLLICRAFQHQEQNVNIHHSGTFARQLKAIHFPWGRHTVRHKVHPRLTKGTKKCSICMFLFYYLSF